MWRWQWAGALHGQIPRHPAQCAGKVPTAQQVLLQALALRVEPRVTGQRVGSGRREDSLQGVRTPGNLFNPLKDACRKGAAGHK